MYRNPQSWIDALDKRIDEHCFRELKLPNKDSDFMSNDYLGMAKSTDFHKTLNDLININPQVLQGATGSRLISGNTKWCTNIEVFLAKIHQVESVLLCPSGYVANLALFSCIASRYDKILVDEQVHRSVHDGCRMSFATKKKFRHNDLEHLEYLLQKSSGNLFVAVESLYSMEGDFAPLTEIIALTEKYKAFLIVDEAHAIGVFGKGIVAQTQLQHKILATVVTYGKAFGLHGAAILGSHILKSYLINFASPIIYSTAMTDYQALSIKAAYDFLENDSSRVSRLLDRIKYFKNQNIKTDSHDNSPIQMIRGLNPTQLENLQEELKQNHILSYIIKSPTVKPGTEGIRICLHEYNTEEEIKLLTDLIKKYQNE